MCWCHIRASPHSRNRPHHFPAHPKRFCSTIPAPAGSQLWAENPDKEKTTALRHWQTTHPCSLNFSTSSMGFLPPIKRIWLKQQNKKIWVFFKFCWLTSDRRNCGHGNEEVHPPEHGEVFCEMWQHLINLNGQFPRWCDNYSSNLHRKNRNLCGEKETFGQNPLFQAKWIWAMILSLVSDQTFPQKNNKV